MKFQSILTGFALLFVVTLSSASVSLDKTMRDHYMEFAAEQPGSENPLPFTLVSGNNDENASASIRYFLNDVTFNILVDRLGQPAEWCEFIPLHLNIKACTYFQKGRQWYLRFYLGVKEYAAPEKSQLLELKFNAERKGNVFVVGLYAEDGPLRSSDIRFDLRAIEINENEQNGIYLEFDTSSTPGLAENLARVYLSTVARSKIGFSIEGETWRGKPKYIHGQRAAVERNLVRYLLAIETYFATLDLDDNTTRYQKRLEHWYDATDKYSDQLYELSRREYLSNKKRERANQDALQRVLLSHSNPNTLDKKH